MTESDITLLYQKLHDGHMSEDDAWTFLRKLRETLAYWSDLYKANIEKDDPVRDKELLGKMDFYAQSYQMVIDLICEKFPNEEHS